MLRSYIDVPGGATVIVPSHPVKNFNVDNLVPYGGGAFLNEVDGNLVCIYDRDTMTVTLTWHGKFRGPDFEPVQFKLVPKTSERLKTDKGRPIWSIAAQVISAEEKITLDATSDRRMDRLLSLIITRPGMSLADMAEALGLFYGNGSPNRSIVQRMLAKLTEKGLVKKDGLRHEATNKGRRAAGRADGDEDPI
jgi:hypothetical protein